jgi:hypothetical protein
MDKDIEFALAHGWAEVKEPALFNFEKIGDRVSGVVLGFANERIDNRDVLTMRLDTGNGDQVKIRPSFDLRQKLGRRHEGKTVLIVFDHENDATEGKGNKMKVFRLLVAPEGQTAAQVPFQAGESDLPDIF